MKGLTFSGGIHPSYEKERTAALAVKPLPPPVEVVLPLSQHIGAPAKACVSKGDEVLLGQLVGEPGGFVSAPVHSSVSGKVLAIEPRPGTSGIDVMSVVVENDGEDRASEMQGTGESWQNADVSYLRDLIRNAGIVGMGGAAFPTHVKLSPPKEKPIDAVILNGAECEPFLTADHRIMLERPETIVQGLLIVQRILGAKDCFIGIELNKKDAVDSMTRAASSHNIKVVPLEVKYPQGAEKQLIDACLGRKVPSGGLPMDVGVVVQNVGTAAAICEAVVKGMPLVERIVTVTGPGIQKASNLSIRIGTPINHAIEQCGGLNGEIGKLISGGPMMGISLHTDAVSVCKGTSGILVFRKEDIDLKDPDPCIRCGRCHRVCPMRLVPTDIAAFARMKMTAEAEQADALDCIECGSCAFGCPSNLPLVQQIRLAKAAIMAEKRKNN